MPEIEPERVPIEVPPPVRGRGRARGPGRGRVVRGRAARARRGRAGGAPPPGFEGYVDEERDDPPTPPYVPPPHYNAPPPPPPFMEPRVSVSQAFLEDLMRRADARAAPVPERAPEPVPGPVTRPMFDLTEEALYLKEFKRYNPPEFDGTSRDPEVADNWITKIERIHTYIKCPDSLKVHCGAYALTDDAMHWWDSTLMTLPPGLQVSWEQFREKFLEKYYPIETRLKMEARFLALKQGDMEVIDLERLFDKLSRHASKFVRTEEDKLDRFMAALRDDLRGRVRAAGPQSYAHALSLAIDLDIKCPESTVKPAGAGFPSSQKRKAEDGHQSRGTQQWQGLSQWTGQSQHGQQHPTPFCQKCSKNHFGICHIFRPCFACGQPGHIARFCPSNHTAPSNRGHTSQGQGQTQGKDSHKLAPQQDTQRQR